MVTHCVSLNLCLTGHSWERCFGEPYKPGNAKLCLPWAWCSRRQHWGDSVLTGLGNVARVSCFLLDPTYALKPWVSAKKHLHMFEVFQRLDWTHSPKTVFKIHNPEKQAVCLTSTYVTLRCVCVCVVQTAYWCCKIQSLLSYLLAMLIVFFLFCYYVNLSPESVSKVSVTETS